jgi:hypothetical protein
VDSDGKGLNIAYEAVDRHAQNHLKIQLHFVLFEKTEVPKTLPIPIKTQNLLMSLKTKDQKGNVFSR